MNEMVDFFERYKRLFDQQEWPAFAALFHEPALSVRRDRSVMAIPTHAEGARLYAQVAQIWRAEKYVRFDIQDFEVIELGHDSRLVTFDWLMLGEDDSLIRRWRQSYQLIRSTEGWQVLSSTFH